MDVKDLADRYQVTPLRMGIRLRELGLDGSATVGSHRPGAHASGEPRP